MEDLKPIFARLWSAACQDAPERPSCRVENGAFVLTIRGNKDRWAEMAKSAGVPSHAVQTIDGDTLTCKWPSHADEIFSKDGLIARALPNYEMRPGQLHMARMVQRSIEMGAPAVIEAPTGIGKSYATAAICMAMNKRAVISTATKNLQHQLYAKDIPFLQTLFPGKRVALAQGKQNYACKLKAEDAESGQYVVSGELLEWYLSTESGNTEEIPFAVEHEELSKITVDAYCAGKACPRYGDCFYYEAKRARADADVVITNHMLLAMHQLYPGAGILPNADVIVVDEAHQYAGYVQNAVGVDLPTTAMTRRVNTLEDSEDVEQTMHRFFDALMDRVGLSTDREIAVPAADRFAAGVVFAETVYEAADELWPEGDMPESPEERKCKVDADRLRNMAGAVFTFSALPDLQDDTQVRWIEQRDGVLSCRVVPHSVAQHIARLAGFAEVKPVTIDHTHCARCNRTLTAATVNVLEGLPYGPDCIRHVDPMGDAEQVLLEEWLNQEPPEPRTVQYAPTPVVFTSATLAAPDMAAFRREAGLPYALEMIAESPFDFAANALLYVPSAADAPAPKQAEYKDFLVEEMARLVHSAQGGAFCLFTSYSNMHYVSQRLRHEFDMAGYEVFVQGQLPKLEISKRFLAAGNGVLFATKSFWEGVSIDGDALRLVIIDKLPFEAPRPLNQAQEAALTAWARAQGMPDKKAQWYPFEALRVPRMIIDLKQGAGRLIRTQADRGVMAILDSRLRSAQYARRLVLPALPPAKLTANFYEVSEFFRDNRTETERQRALSTLPPVQQMDAVVNDMSELETAGEIPF